MSFRSFIYYCSLGGGCAAYLGWVLGRLPPLENSVGRAAVQGMFLGMALAVGRTRSDALWNLAASEGLEVAWRVLVGGFVGGLGGFAGGALGQLLYGRTQWKVFLLLGWAFTGLLIGLAPGLYDLFARLMRDEDTRGARRKVVNGVLGGSAGGLLGGLLFLLLSAGWGLAFGEMARDFWSPSATGFVALGLCIGLLIGLAQVILKEAWLKVEAG